MEQIYDFDVGSGLQESFPISSRSGAGEALQKREFPLFWVVEWCFMSDGTKDRQVVTTPRRY
jgi:hypothetical protein